MGWWRRLFTRAKLERQLDAEVADHLERQIADYERAGLSHAEARRQALLAFGGPETVKEACRDARGTRWLEDLSADVRYALRRLWKHPAFATVAILSLALGIGATAAIFSLVDAVLLKTLPVRAPDQLVLLAERAGPRLNLSWSLDQFRALRQSEALTGVCAFRPRTDFGVTRAGETTLAAGQLVSGNCFDVLGLRAAAGRLLSDADELGPPVAVISDGFWRRHFDGDPDIAGRTVSLKGRTVTIVGVTPPGFQGFEAGRAIDITVPLSAQSWVLPGPMLSSPNVRWVRLIGRRRPGVSIDGAAADLERRWRALAITVPRPGTPAPRFELLDGAQGLNDLRDQFSLPLRLLMAAVGVLLLIACANLASVTLARARAREHEVTLRRALGASRGRLVRQLLTESVVLSLVGGVAGLIVAYWGSRGVVALLSRGRSPIVLDLAVDTRLALFTAGVSLLASVGIGMWPAVSATRPNLQPRLQAGARPVIGGSRSNILIAAQAVLSVVLVIASVLFARSLVNLYAVDPRVGRDQVMLVMVRPGISKQEGPSVADTFHGLATRLTGVPGVRSITRTMDLPFSGSSYRANISIPGEPADDSEQVSFNFVGPRFFGTMGIPLIAGRDLQETDDARSAPVAVISRSLASHYFPGRNAVGAHLAAGQDSIEVVGIAADIPYEGARAEKESVLYRPSMQAGRMDGAAGTFAVRADLPPAALAFRIFASTRKPERRGSFGVRSLVAAGARCRNLCLDLHCADPRPREHC
jgi:predicted permease